MAEISAGELRHRIAIQSQAVSFDTRGQNTGAWATTATVWGKVETLDGREQEIARKLYADASLRVTLRYLASSSLTMKHRLLFGSRVLNIGHINKVNQVSEAHVLLCGEDKA